MVESLRTAAKYQYSQIKARLQNVLPGHLAGLLLVFFALFVFDDSAVGVVHFIEAQGISPRFYALILAACGSLLLMAPRGINNVLLLTPLSFYVIMAWLYFMPMPPDQRLYVPPFLYSGLYFFMVVALIQDGNKALWAAK